MKKVSIVVPIYKMKDGLGEKLLVDFLSMIQSQSFKDFDIVISDQSNSESFKHIIDTFSHVLDIKYYQTDDSVDCAGKNVNNALSKATGEIIKLLYCDDYFINYQALQKIVDQFDSTKDKHWLLCGFAHSDYDKINYFDVRSPWYGNKYVNGDNTTGNPSAYAVRNSHKLKMDENLLFIVDGEYFYQSYFCWGDPIIIQEPLVCFREHPQSAFRDEKLINLRESEMKYCEEKYKTISREDLIGRFV